MLNKCSNEQNKFFKSSKQNKLSMFSTKKELKKKIKFILQNPKKAEKVRKFGNSIVGKPLYKSS